MICMILFFIFCLIKFKPIKDPKGLKIAVITDTFILIFLLFLFILVELYKKLLKNDGDIKK